MKNKNNAIKILIKLQNQLYYLAQVCTAGDDGSLYVFFVRDGENTDIYSFSSENNTPTLKKLSTPRKNTKKISYHPTGRINYHHTSKTIFGEPLSRITCPNIIAIYTVPSISKLNIFNDEVQEQDFIWELSDDRQSNFCLFISPLNTLLPPNIFAIRCKDRFALVFEKIENFIASPMEVSSNFVTVIPTKGLFAAQQMDESTALIKYNQWLYETEGLILCSPNGEGVYKIITIRPMRVAPKLEIIFLKANDFYAEQLEVKPSIANTFVKFKVRNKKTDNLVRGEVPIANISLDSELY